MTVHHKHSQASIPDETNSLGFTKSSGIHAIATHIDLYNVFHTAMLQQPMILIPSPRLTINGRNGGGTA